MNKAGKTVVPQFDVNSTPDPDLPEEGVDNWLPLAHWTKRLLAQVFLLERFNTQFVANVEHRLLEIDADHPYRQSVAQRWKGVRELEKINGMTGDDQLSALMMLKFALAENPVQRVRESEIDAAGGVMRWIQANEDLFNRIVERQAAVEYDQELRAKARAASQNAGVSQSSGGGAVAAPLTRHAAARRSRFGDVVDVEPAPAPVVVGRRGRMSRFDPDPVDEAEDAPPVGRRGMRGGGGYPGGALAAADPAHLPVAQGIQNGIRQLHDFPEVFSGMLVVGAGSRIFVQHQESDAGRMRLVRLRFANIHEVNQWEAEQHRQVPCATCLVVMADDATHAIQDSILVGER